MEIKLFVFEIIWTIVLLITIPVLLEYHLSGLESLSSAYQLLHTMFIPDLMQDNNLIAMLSFSKTADLRHGVYSLSFSLDVSMEDRFMCDG